MDNHVLRKCPMCRKLIDRDAFEQHQETCKLRFAPKQYKKQEIILFECRGCNQVIEKPRLLLHLHYESVSCRQAYSKTDFVNIFEIWMRHYPESPNLLKELKTAYSITEKCKFDSSRGLTIFCNSCGKSFNINDMRSHLSDSKQCRANRQLLGDKNCKFCSLPYQQILIHLNQRPECRKVVFDENNDFPTINNQENHSNLDKNDSKSDIMETCFGCKEPFKRNSIMKHIKHKKSCEKEYPADVLDKLMKICEESRDHKRRKWNDRRSGVTSKRSKAKTYLDLLEQDKIDVSSAKTLHQKVTIKNQPKEHIINCNGCQKYLNLSTILKHLGQKKICKEKYSQTEFQKLEKQCSNHKKKLQKYKRVVKLNIDIKHKKYWGTRTDWYMSLKNKIQDWHMKCLQAIDLDKLFHYQWEIAKAARLQLSNDQSLKVKSIERSLKEKIEKLEKHIESSIFMVKNNVAKWCFQANILTDTDLKFQDMKFINSKCREIHLFVLQEFNIQLTLVFDALKEICTGLNHRVNPFKYCHRLKWDYEKYWQKWKDQDYIPPNAEEAEQINSFIVKETKDHLSR